MRVHLLTHVVATYNLILVLLAIVIIIIKLNLK